MKRNGTLNKVYFFLSKINYLNSKKISDVEYISRIYYENTGEKLNLKNPVSYNEKLQWLKLYDRNPLYTVLVDKFEVRKFVTERIGEKYLVKLYEVKEKFDDIRFELLPHKFVIKATHDSNSIIICTDKSKFDFIKSRKKLQSCLKLNYFYFSREWPYKNVKPKLICEEYLEDTSQGLIDYKVFCFNGIPKFIQVHFDRLKKHRVNNYSTTWEYLDVQISNFSNDKHKAIPKPRKLNELLELASLLSRNLPQSRIDFYIVKNKIYFSEITLFHAGGMALIKPKSFNIELGRLIDLDLAYKPGNTCNGISN